MSKCVLFVRDRSKTFGLKFTVVVLEITIFYCQIETTDQILHTECQSNEYVVFVSSLTTFIRPRKHILLEVKRAIRAECIVLSTFS